MEKDKIYYYSTEIIGTTKVHNMKSDFTIKIDNEIIYKGFDDKGLHRFIIRETNYELSKYEDPIMVQIAEMTNRICSIYKELDISISSLGVPKVLNNKNDIRKKWQDVKEWLMNAHPLEAYDIVRAKEFELSNEELELKNLSFIHFVQQFFFIYGRTVQSSTTSYIRKDEMDRFGAGIVIPIALNLSQSYEEGNIIKKFEGKMLREDGVIGRLRNFAKDKFMHPEYKITGKYIYNNNVLHKSSFTITEQLGEHYYHHSFFNLTLKRR